MDMIKTTIQAVTKRPFIIIMIGLLMLAAAIVNTFIPVIAVIIGIINMTGGNIFDSVVSLLQMLIDPALIPALLIAVAVLTLLASVAGGLLLPGYLLVVDDGLSKGNKKPGLFSEGLKRYFLRFFLMMVKTVLCMVLFGIFLLVCAIPAIVVTRAALGTKPDLLLGAIFIDFITVGVLFMCLSFFRAYISMWFVAAAKGEDKPFKAGKAVADRNFWSMVLNLLVYDIVFIAIIFLIYSSDIQILRYTAGWVFTTVYFTLLASYLVQIYNEAKRDPTLL